MYVTHLEPTRSDSSRETIGGAESVNEIIIHVKKQRREVLAATCAVGYSMERSPPLQLRRSFVNRS
jgi:hypothetical protein